MCCVDEARDHHEAQRLHVGNVKEKCGGDFHPTNDPFLCVEQKPRFHRSVGAGCVELVRY
jgi:hypothetical protein